MRRGSSRRLLMWLGSILFVGSFVGNPALARRAADANGPPRGVFAITRHPMMWGFALWAFVHLVVVATPKALVLRRRHPASSPSPGRSMQDRKKARLMGERWHEWTAQTAFVPFARGARQSGAVRAGRRDLAVPRRDLAASACRPGFWRWFG